MNLLKKKSMTAKALAAEVSEFARQNGITPGEAMDRIAEEFGFSVYARTIVGKADLESQFEPDGWDRLDDDGA